MEKVEVIKLENGKEYAVISSIEYNNIEYLLLCRTENEKIVSNELEIYKKNTQASTLEEINNENEYELLKEVFNRKLEEIRNA